MAEKYNGWTNYETWAINLWMENEEGSYRYYKEMARECDSVGELADRMQEEHEDSNPCQGMGVYADLMNSALSAVNWYEVAEDIWDEVYPNGKDEDEESEEEDNDGED